MTYSNPTARATTFAEMTRTVEQYHNEGTDAFVLSFETADTEDGYSNLYNIYRVTDPAELEDWLEDNLIEGPGDEHYNLPYFEDLTPDCDEFMGDKVLRLERGHIRIHEVWAIWKPRESGE